MGKSARPSSPTSRWRGTIRPWRVTSVGSRPFHDWSCSTTEARGRWWPSG